jgi:hypothetical protein
MCKKLGESRDDDLVKVSRNERAFYRDVKLIYKVSYMSSLVIGLAFPSTVQ